MSRNAELKKRKQGLLSKKLAWLYTAYFILSDFIFWPAAANVGVFGMDFINYCLHDISFWGFYILKYAIVMIVFFLNMQRILQYDPGSTDQKSYKKAERGIRTLERHMLWWEGISVLIVAPAILMAAKISGIRVIKTALVLQMIGTSGIIACFIYVPFLDQFEKWVSDKVPFTPESKIHIGNTERGVLVVMLNSYCQVFIVLSCFLCFDAMENTTITSYIGRSVGPQVVINVLLSTFTTYNQFHGNAIRIRKITAALKKVASNDYTETIEGSTSREEFGIMAKSMNEFIESTRNLLGSIQGTAMESHVMARELAVQTGITGQAVEKIMASTDDMNSSVDQENTAFGAMKESGDAITTGINRLDQDVQNQVAAVEQSSAAIEEMVSNIRSVTTILDKNAVTVSSLSDASTEGRQKIAQSVSSADKILKDSAGLLEASTVIQNIAEQTNLLAMNAAIEAAHAGEAGRGFAVVANEIRKLAEDSNKQGKVITDSLQKLQESIKEISDNTTAVRDNFNKIYELTDQVHNQEDVIKAAMDEQSEGSTQVLDAVKQLTEISASVTDSSKLMLANNKKITTDMKLMADALNNFTVTMNSVSKNAAEISRAVQDTKNATEKNNVGIEKLKISVEKFVV